MKHTLVMALAGVLLATAVTAGDVVTGVVDPYLRIQKALTSDSMTGVKENAEVIATASERLGPGAASLKTAAEQLKAAADLAAARVAFASVSDALLGYAEETKANLGTDARTAYCPMEKKYWIQTQGQIENPYGGKSMVHCGKFVTAREK